MHELPQRHRITVEHFYRMAEVGLFGEDERVELVEGEIVDVPPMGHHHAGVVGYLAKLLDTSVSSLAVVRQQLPLRLGEYSEPLPDIVVAKPRDDQYFRAHPTANDVCLVVEVSSTTLRFDRNVKVPMYARHGVQVPRCARLRRRPRAARCATRRFQVALHQSFGIRIRLIISEPDTANAIVSQCSRKPATSISPSHS